MTASSTNSGRSDGVVSVLIPARNEAGHIAETCRRVITEMETACLAFELVVVNDNSTDQTRDVLQALAAERPDVLQVIDSPDEPGLGRALRAGIPRCSGEWVVITMADGSDAPRDMIRYVDKLREGFDGCFGTRWHPDAQVRGYPLMKKLLNRIGNHCLRFLFGFQYNDISNAFKAYRREPLMSLLPLRSEKFEVTVELPLRFLFSGNRCAQIPVDWTQRRYGRSAWRIKELGSGYGRAILRLIRERNPSGKHHVSTH